MRLFEIEADYRPNNDNKPRYYVLAKSKRDAKRKFENKVTWLDVYGCKEVVDEEMSDYIYAHPEQYILC